MTFYGRSSSSWVSQVFFLILLCLICYVTSTFYWFVGNQVNHIMIYRSFQNEKLSDRRKPIQEWSLKQPLPKQLTWIVHSFPFSAPVDVETLQKLIGFLPKSLWLVVTIKITTAMAFGCESWRSLFQKDLIGIFYPRYIPVSEVEFTTTIFQPWYEPVHTLYNDPLGAHRLSVLYFILALGCLIDPEGQSHLPEARWYYHLGKASLALEPVLDSPSFSTIQALVRCCQILCSSCWKWSLVAYDVLYALGQHTWL